MKQSSIGARPFFTAFLFFAVGVLFASAMEWTPLTHAQQQATALRPASADLKSLEETSNAFVAIAEHVTPAVVAIQTRSLPRTASGRGSQQPPPDMRGLPPEWRQFFEAPQGPPPPREGTGSGFVISSDGYIVTNNHVVADADRITVLMNDHKTYPATLVGRDDQTDVAVLKIDARNLPTVALGDDERLRIGEWVLAVGNPLGLEFTVTAGIVSAKGRGNREVPVNQGNSWAITDFIQTDAAINPGNSGGPLVNIRGEVVGINTAIASGTGYYAGYGFAIPVGLARTVWQDLIENGRVRRAALGVNIDEVSPADAKAAGLDKITGVIVRGCSTAAGSSPACSAGVEAGDVILSIDGKPVDRVSGLQRAVRAKKPGETVTVKLMRYGTERDYRVRLVEARTEPSPVAAADRGSTRPESGNASKLGVELEPVSDQFAQTAKLPEKYRGLRVTDVDLAGPSRGRLFLDDVIVGVMPANTPIRTLADLQRVLDGKKAGDVVSLRVYRPQSDGEVVVNLTVGG